VLQRRDARRDDLRIHAGDLGQRGRLVVREGTDKGGQRGRGEAGADGGFGDVAGDLAVEAVVQGGGVDGREDGCGDGAGGGRDGGGGGDEMMRRGELDARDDEDERRAEPDARESREDEGPCGVAGLDGGEADDARGEYEEAEEQRFADRAQPGARITPEDGGQAARDPIRLLSSR